MKFITLSGIRFNISRIIAYEKVTDSDINKHKSYVYVMNDDDRFIVSERVEEIDEIIEWELRN